MRARTIFLGFAAMFLASASVFGTDAVELMRRAQESDKYVSYRGMKTANVRGRRGQATAMLKVVHLKPDKTRTEYFLPAVLAGVLTIQDGNDMWRFSPRKGVWEPTCCPRIQCRNEMSQEAIENFNIRLVGSDQVAGRDTYVIYASPKFPGGTARRMWVDREHYLVMGTQVESKSGQVISSSCFTRIEFNPTDISPSIFKVTSSAKEPVKPAPNETFKALKPSYVPPGYRLIGVGRLMVQKRECSQLQFSNGVNTISVFQRKAGCDMKEPKIDGKLLNIFTRNSKGMRFTLMGSVPKSELQKMAESIR